MRDEKQLNADDHSETAPDAISVEVRDASRPEHARGGIGLKDDFIMALRFFSRLPTGSSPHQKPDLGRIAMALPLASVAIGIGPALLFLGATLIGLPPYFSAALGVAAMVIASGGMAEDALADSMDGLFGGYARERRLEIMKDSRHGTYGVAAMCLFLLLRVTALGAVATTSPLAAAAIWLAATIVGRSGALWLAVALPAARSDGASAAVGRLPRLSFIIGALFAVVLLFLLGGPASGILSLVVALLLSVGVIAGWAAICQRLVGGQTGDLIGALGALIEIAVLSALITFV